MHAQITMYNVKRYKTILQTHSMAFSSGMHKSTGAPAAFEYEQLEDSDLSAGFSFADSIVFGK